MKKHTTHVDIRAEAKKGYPKFQAVCSCGWRSQFIRYAKHNAEHDEFVHNRDVKTEEK